MMQLSAAYSFYLSAVLFCTGIFIALTRRNAVVALMGVELMLAAANLNFIAFNQVYPEKLDGQLFALIVMVIAAAEAAVALAIILNLYQKRGNVNLEKG
jgi:NADH-quinone oxidoreductase subunit K